jgi:hypothetical protein
MIVITVVRTVDWHGQWRVAEGHHATQHSFDYSLLASYRRAERQAETYAKALKQSWDMGGTGGYADIVEAIRDPRHKNHKDMLESVGRRFDPEKFRATAATGEMRR